jgi:hypothetical protein
MNIKSVLQSKLGNKKKAKRIVLDHFTWSTRVHQQDRKTMRIIIDSFAEKTGRYAKRYSYEKRKDIIKNMSNTLLYLDSETGHGINFYFGIHDKAICLRELIKDIEKRYE